MTLFYHFDETQPLKGRLAMGIEYDGSRFCGFQRLKHAASVQAAVEDALTKVASAPVQIHASGRTDSGVHATRQVIHFDPPPSALRKPGFLASIQTCRAM